VASEATGAGGLAERYALALYELADEAKTLDQVADDLRGLRALVAESADLRRLIRSPVLGREQQGKAVAALAERAGLNPLTRNFLGLLARNRRLFALPEMIGSFLAPWPRGAARSRRGGGRPRPDAGSTRQNRRAMRKAVGQKSRSSCASTPASWGPRRQARLADGRRLAQEQAPSARDGHEGVR